MRAALVVEWLKMRRSRVPRVAAIALLVLPAVMAALFLGMSGGGGSDAMTLKAEALVTRGGWAGFLDVLLQIYASAGLLGMGVVVAWCFGREYADRTVGSLYGSATPREVVAAAKLVVVTVWCLGLSVLLAPAAVLVGLAAGLGPPDAAAVAGVTTLAGPLFQFISYDFAFTQQSDMVGFTVPQTTNVVPPTSVITVEARKNKPGSGTTAPAWDVDDSSPIAIP